MIYEIGIVFILAESFIIDLGLFFNKHAGWISVLESLLDIQGRGQYKNMICQTQQNIE